MFRSIKVHIFEFNLNEFVEVFFLKLGKWIACKFKYYDSKTVINPPKSAFLHLKNSFSDRSLQEFLK